MLASGLNVAAVAVVELHDHHHIQLGMILGVCLDESRDQDTDFGVHGDVLKKYTQDFYLIIFF